MQVEFYDSVKNIDFIHVYVFESRNSMFAAHSLDGSTHHLTVLKL